MKILVSDVNADCKTICGKFICFSNKYENIEGINKKVYAVEIETGLRVLNPDFKVNVKPIFAH